MTRAYRVRDEDSSSYPLPRAGGGLGWGRCFRLTQSSVERTTPAPTHPHLGGGGKRSVLARALLLLLLATIALAPAACGRKGAPVLPPGKTDEFPSKYPKTTDPQTGVFSN